MANAFLPRELVHEWSDSIGADPTEHQATLTRLLKAQRRLTKFVEENQADMEPATAGVTIYLVGVLVRLFDLAGGQLRSATWAQLREASAKVQAPSPAYFHSTRPSRSAYEPLRDAHSRTFLMKPSWPCSNAALAAKRKPT